MSEPLELTADDVPSLGVIEEALVHEDASWRERANNLDTKAGVLLSGAGVIVAIVGVTSDILALIGQVLAIAAGGTAVWALWPRVDKVIDPKQLRDIYLTTGEIDTRLSVLNTRLDMHEKNEEALLAKGRRWRITAILMLAAAAAIVGSGIVDVVRG